ncbi:MAG: hypothetical protein HC871_15160 [Rhizobiales bacterium]|nr:hypothetical protein [Hyphomicrobiales bacterium]
MVDSIKSIAARIGAVCYADPFVATTDDTVEESVLTRAMGCSLCPPAGSWSSSLSIAPGGDNRCRRIGRLKQG